MFFLGNTFLIRKLNVFPYFHNQKHECQVILFFIFVNARNFDWKLYVFKIKLFDKNLCQSLCNSYVSD